MNFISIITVHGNWTDYLLQAEKFVNITRLFAEAKKQILEGSWDQEKAEKMTSEISKLHPENRELDTGFFYIDPSAIK